MKRLFAAVIFVVLSYLELATLASNNTILFLSYLGGSGDEAVAFDHTSIAVDSEGSILIAGTSSSVDYPLRRSFQNSNHGGNDAVVTKIDSSGRKILFSTYIGGTSNDTARAIAVAPNGNIFVAGITFSNDFPVSAGGLQNENGSFLAMFAPSGNLLRSTYLSGVPTLSKGGLQDMVVDEKGNIYIAADATIGVRTVRPIQQDDGCEGKDVFVAKLDAHSWLPVFSTCLGSGGVERVFAISVDQTGNIFTAGTTYNSRGRFPTTENAFQRKPAARKDVFVAKINPTQSRLVYSTLLGGKNDETPTGIVVTPAGRAVVTGNTRSPDFPLKRALQNSNSSSSAFVTKLNANASDLVFSTYIGGSASDFSSAVALDDSNNIVIVGNTTSIDFPVTTVLSPFLGHETFVLKLNSNGQRIQFSTLIGGSGGDLGTDLDVDALGNIYLVGRTNSSDLPVLRALQPTFRGGLYDQWLAKIASPTQ